jgi:two-component system, OmpR family, response regulator ResD
METAENKRFIYEFGKFVLDPQEKTLFVEGLPVHLPAKEFETLILLVENNGKALSKDEMMQAIWQDTFVEETRSGILFSLTFEIKI